MKAGRNEISSCLPHGESMVLLDRVETWDSASIVCIASNHRDTGNPLRRRGRLSAVCGIEYAAQAAAVHAALNDARDGLGGARLGGVSNVTASRPCLDDIDGDLRIYATVLTAQTNGAIYSFSVGPLSGPPAIEGRFIVMYG